MSEDIGQIKIRLGDLTKHVDGFIKHVKKTTGLEPSRTDAVTALLKKGISAFETEQKEGKG